MFLCGLAPLREIVFQSYGGWDGEGFAQRRRGAEVGTINVPASFAAWRLGGFSLLVPSRTGSGGKAANPETHERKGILSPRPGLVSGWGRRPTADAVGYPLTVLRT